jgi:hypothetical protein
VIQSLAEKLVGMLRTRDPLSERVHATKPEALVAAGSGVAKTLLQRAAGRRARSAARVTP